MGKPKMWNISKTYIHRVKRITDRRAKRNYGIMKFYLTQDHMQLEMSKCYFSHNFHWSPSKLCDNIGYPD